jgi:uncharacterized protein
MGQALPAGIPTLAETGWTREQLLDSLSKELALPVAAVSIAAQFPIEIEAAVVALLERAPREELDRPSDRLLFRGIHILGAARCSVLYRPLVALLRRAGNQVRLLEDTVAETLSPILASVFDGDTAPLTGLITDTAADEFVRNDAFGTLAFLTFDGRILREEATAFLRRFEQDNATPAEDMAWYGWMAAVALLGLDELTPRVHAAFADGRIPAYVAEERHYREMLEQALARPHDTQRFRDEHHGYIDDAVRELEQFSPEVAETGSAPHSGGPSPALARRMEVVDTKAQRVLSAPDSGPAQNPWKGVGRNDPCPCGSGKKFKKCCGTGG